MIAISIVTGALGVLQTYMSNVVGQQVMHDLRSAVYRHLQRLSLAFFTRTRTGEIQSRISNDIGGVETVVTSTATSIVSNLTTVIATVVAMFLHGLAARDLLARPAAGFPVPDEARRSRAPANHDDAAADTRRPLDPGRGVAVGLRDPARPDDGPFSRSWATVSRRSPADLARLEVQSRMAGRWVMALIQTTFAVMPAAVYWFGGWSMAHGAGAISIGTLVAFTTLQTRLFFPIGQLLSVGVDVQTSLALFDRVFEYLDLTVDLDEKPDAVELGDCRGDVTFEHAWFRYSPDGPWTLEDLSVAVSPGETLAIVGETGAGKTTMAYLVARLYDVERGRVTIDGHDVRDVTFASLARTVGVVSQETYLFHDTVRENLRFARPDATDEEIEEAARAARIHDLVASLPDGYDTVVGERGYRFSGGEKQRIAIARTILRNPPVLVLDEATSALDTQTERAVQEALDRLAEGRTTIAIAHRLSTVRDAEQDRRPRRRPDRRARHARGATRARGALCGARVARRRARHAAVKADLRSLG